MAYSTKCPYCKRTISWGSGGPHKEIASPVKRCSCGHRYIDQNMYEWSVLDPTYKFWYCFFANNRFLIWYILFILCFKSFLYLLIGGPVWMLICYAWVNVISKQAIFESYNRCKDEDYLEILRNSDYCGKLAKQYRDPTPIVSKAVTVPSSSAQTIPTSNTAGSEDSIPFYLSPLCSELTKTQLEFLAMKWSVPTDAAKKLVDYERLKQNLPPIYEKTSIPDQNPQRAAPTAKRPGRYAKKKEKKPIGCGCCVMFLVALALGVALIVALPTVLSDYLPTSPTEPPTTHPYPLVYASDRSMLLKPDYECICPFDVTVDSVAQQTNDFYVFLEYICPFPYGLNPSLVERNVNSGSKYSSDYDTRIFTGSYVSNVGRNDNLGVFINMSPSFSVDVPPGCYRLWYCFGESWYGLDHFFGDDTVWHTSDDILTFYYDSEYVYGQTITLKLVENGNMETRIAKDSELPDALK